VIFAPTVVYMFPSIPAWIGRIFPTYYLLQPVIDISQKGAGWAQVRFDAIILAAIDAGMIVLLALLLWRARQRTQTI
jgi:ABC-2 type transport system permease protein